MWKKYISFLTIILIFSLPCVQAQTDLDKTLEAIEQTGAQPIPMDSAQHAELLKILTDPNGLDKEKLLALHKKIKSEWQEIISEDGSFRIEFPRYAVEIDTSVILDADRKFKLFTYSINTSERDDDNLAYLVNYYHLGEKVKESEHLFVFNDRRDLLLQQWGDAVLDHDKEIVYQEMKGRDYLFTVDEEIKIRTRIFIKDNIVYTLAVIALDEDNYNSAQNKFLTSFRILAE